MPKAQHPEDLCNSGDVYFLRATLNVSLPRLGLQKSADSAAFVITAYGRRFCVARTGRQT